MPGSFSLFSSEHLHSRPSSLGANPHNTFHEEMREQLRLICSLDPFQFCDRLIFQVRRHISGTYLQLRFQQFCLKCIRPVPHNKRMKKKNWNAIYSSNHRTAGRSISRSGTDVNDCKEDRLTLGGGGGVRSLKRLQKKILVVHIQGVRCLIVWVRAAQQLKRRSKVVSSDRNAERKIFFFFFPGSGTARSTRWCV